MGHKITFIDCDLEAGKCQAAGVQWYPTRIGIGGAKYEGTQPLENLAKISECTLTLE